MAGEIREEIRSGLGWSAALGVLMIVAGILAIAAPWIAALSAAILVAWAVLFGGIAQIAHAVQTRGEGRFVVKLLIGILYVVAGFWLLGKPVVGVLSLALFLGAILFVTGIAECVLAFQARPSPGWGWHLFSGILSVVLGLMIGAQWPWGAGWVIGTFLGISLVAHGITRLMFSMAARAVIKPA